MNCQNVKCLDCHRGIQDDVPNLDVMVKSARTMCGHGVSRPAYFGDHQHSMAENIYVTLMAWVSDGSYDKEDCTHRVLFTMNDGTCMVLAWNKGVPLLGWNVCHSTSTASSTADDMQVGKVMNFHSAELLETIFCL